MQASIKGPKKNLYSKLYAKKKITDAAHAKGGLRPWAGHWNALVSHKAVGLYVLS